MLSPDEAPPVAVVTNGIGAELAVMVALAGAEARALRANKTTAKVKANKNDPEIIQGRSEEDKKRERVEVIRRFRIKV